MDRLEYNMEFMGEADTADDASCTDVVVMTAPKVPNATSPSITDQAYSLWWPGLDPEPDDHDEPDPAEVLIETTTSLRIAMWKHGWRPVEVYHPNRTETFWGKPIPEKNGGKQPVGRAWEAGARANIPEAIATVRHGATNTGLLCDGLRVIDIDVDDPALASNIRTLTEELLGLTPLVRIRDGSPRMAMIYRAEHGTPAKQFVAAKNDKVEVLGFGQQLVVDGRHRSGAYITWECAAPWDVSRDEVPAVTDTQIESLLSGVRTILGVASDQAAEDGAPTIPTTNNSRPLTLADIESALSVIPYRGYDQWIRLVAAVKAADPSPQACAAVESWFRCNKPDYEPADASRLRDRWNQPLRRVGPGTLIHMARQSDPAWVSPSMIAKAPSPSEVASDDGCGIKEPKRLRAMPLRADILRRPPQPREWLYGTSILRSHVSMLGAPGGVGKTTLATAMAVSVAAGRSILDPSECNPNHRVHKRANVWLFNLEDPQDENERRMSAAMRQYEVRPNEIAERLFMNSGRDQALIVATKSTNGTVVRTPQVDELVEEIVAKDIGLLVVDPFVHSHDLDENNNPAMAAAMKAWSDVAHRTNCAVLLIHHFRKGGEGGSMDSFRGGGALAGAARIMQTCRTMTQKEGEELGLLEGEHRSYMKWEFAKANMATMGDGQWFKLIGVSLENPTEDYPDGDVAQALQPVDFANVEKQSITPDQTRAVIELIQQATRTRSPYGKNRGTRWIGNAFMEVLGCSERSATRYVKEWFDADYIRWEGTGHKKPNGSDGGAVVVTELSRNLFGCAT